MEKENVRMELGKEEGAFDVAGYGEVWGKNEIKSEVETALRWDCFLNLFSLDQIPQFRYNSKISNEVINFRAVESFLKKENNILASTQTLTKFDQKCCANFIHSHPRLFHSSATPSLTLSPRIRQSSSVNVEFSSILSNLLRSNSLASLSLITALISSFNADFVFSSSSIPGILTTNSPISITTNNIGNAYINTFSLPRNPKSKLSSYRPTVLKEKQDSFLRKGFLVKICGISWFFTLRKEV